MSHETKKAHDARVKAEIAKANAAAARKKAQEVAAAEAAEEAKAAAEADAAEAEAHAEEQAAEAAEAEDAAEAAEAKKKAEVPPVSRTGVLYCVDGESLTVMGNLSMQTPGDKFELAGNGKCTVNGKETSLDDLKRGDKITFSGEPVAAIDATR